MTNETRSLEQLVHAGDVAMLTTQSVKGEMTSRPLTVAQAGDGFLTFLVDSTAPWLAGFSSTSGPEVNVAVSGARNTWVSIAGRATLGSDRSTLERLWSPAASAYFDSVNDPRLAALQVIARDGEYWSAPGGGPIGRLVAVVGAALGRDPGAHGAITPN